jgi:hypothetical protein
MESLKPAIPALILIILTLSSCHDFNTNKKYSQNPDDSTKTIIKELSDLLEKFGKRNNVYNCLDIDSADLNEIKQTIKNLKKERERDLEYLSIINEPDMAAGIPENSEIYRLTWMRAFDPDAVVIRIENNNDKITLTTKIVRIASDAPNVKDTAVLLNTFTKTLNIKDWNTFNRLIYNCYFWDITRNLESGGFDGSWWTLEGAINIDYLRYYPSYHVVAKWSPGGNSYGDACEFLIQLTGLDFGEIY